MKKILHAVEDLFVAAAFAEAGVYDLLFIKTRPMYKEAVRLQAV